MDSDNFCQNYVFLTKIRCLAKDNIKCHCKYISIKILSVGENPGLGSKKIRGLDPAGVEVEKKFGGLDPAGVGVEKIFRGLDPAGVDPGPRKTLYNTAY